jgi:adenylate kinase
LPGTIIVAGIPGVGKTTVLQELEAAGQRRNIPIKIVNFGDVMNRMFKNSGRELHRDHMRRQDINQQTRIQQQAARKIAKMSGKSSLIVDTHMFVRTTDGIWPGTPKRVLEALRPSLIVLIEAEPDEVAKRRIMDNTRERGSETVEEAKADLEWSRYMASANAVLAGIPIQIVVNHEGQQHQAAKDLLSLIEKLN